MFQDTLLIIKCDYMHKRKELLLYLNQQGFHIKGHRMVLFSPELAAEFYQDISEDPCFMIQVIMLSKGNAKAFILAKENAVEDLMNILMCYFGGSIAEMQQNVHVTRCLVMVAKEISFIFPNYLSEPFNIFKQTEFCSKNSLVRSLFDEIYNISTNPNGEAKMCWKHKLAEWLTISNQSIPRISKQCLISSKHDIGDMAQQTSKTASNINHHSLSPRFSKYSCLNSTIDGESLKISTSSCVSCSSFGSGNECDRQ